VFNIEPRNEVDEKWALTFEWRQSFRSTTATLSTIIEKFKTVFFYFCQSINLIKTFSNQSEGKKTKNFTRLSKLLLYEKIYLVSFSSPHVKFKVVFKP